MLHKDKPLLPNSHQARKGGEDGSRGLRCVSFLTHHFALIISRRSSFSTLALSPHVTCLQVTILTQITQAVHPNIPPSRLLPLHPKDCEDQGYHNELGGHNFKSRTFMKNKAYRSHSYKRKRARVAGCKPLMKRIWGTSACPASSLASACSYLSNRSRVCSNGGAGEVKSRREPPPSHTWGGDGGWKTSALTF